MTIATLQSLRNDFNFDLFWRKLDRIRSELNVNEPQLPRRRMLPKRFDDGNAEAEFDTDCKEYYRKIYYEAMDLVINCVQERFDQIG